MKTQICRECGCIGKPSKALLNQLVSFDDFGNDAGKRGTTQSRHGEAKEVDCLKCPNCGHSWISEKSDREQAIEWFSKFSSGGKTQLCDMNTQLVGSVRRWETLTGREIEQIWRKETQQDSLNSYSDLGDEMFALPKEKRPQVDFGRLSLTLNHILGNEKMHKYYAQSELFNLGLFLELLSKSSTFAHKAHKSLNKLMK